MNRRNFLSIAAASTAIAAAPVDGAVSSAVTSAVTSAPTSAVGSAKAIAFDGFTVFDPAPIATLAQEIFPEQGGELVKLWRIRQFEYCWLRTLMGNYTDFWSITESALVFAADALKLELSDKQREKLMQSWLLIRAYPDALPALNGLRRAGVRLAFLANLTPGMMAAAVENSRLEGVFEQSLSTDAVRAFKPDPRAYRMGIHAFGLRREDIVFAAFGGWDAAGARAFGYRTFWVNRQKQPVEGLGVSPDAIGTNLADLARYVLGPDRY